jgi:hypothetical protein
VANGSSGGSTPSLRGTGSEAGFCPARQETERRVRKLTGDAELPKARARFDAVGPDAKALRDLVAHLDEYAVGGGQRQAGKMVPPLSESYLETFIYWTDGGGTNLSLGDKRLDLRAAATAATELAQVVERVRGKYLKRAEQEANAALHAGMGRLPCKDPSPDSLAGSGTDPRGPCLRRSSCACKLRCARLGAEVTGPTSCGASTV